MIVLYTGVPGSGKTSKVIAELVKITDRPIFVMGIPDLKVPHQVVPPVSEWTRLEGSPEDPALKRPVFNFPAHALIVIDEAQNVYRPRAAGSKVPDIVAAFETHRHTGVDFWLITQHPGLLDSNIRKLIGKHVHVHVAPLGRKLLEWAQCRDPESKTDRADAIRSDYKPDPKVFGLYKSAEAHTKIKRSISKSVYLLIASCIALPLVLWLGYSRISAKLEGGKPGQGVEVAQAGRAAAGPVAAPQPTAAGPVGPPRDVQSYIASITPVHPNYPESAPAYDAVRVVKSMPIVAGCIKTATFCRCYSQQSTVLDIQADRCADIVANKVFDPYRDPVQLAKLEKVPDPVGVEGSGAIAPSKKLLPRE